MEYKKELCEDLIKFAERGLGLNHWCAKMLITLDELEDMRVLEPAFDKACKVAKLKQELWWFCKLKDGLNKKKDFNTAGWNAVMNNEFGWSQKQDPKAQVVAIVKGLEQIVEEDEMARIAEAANVIELKTAKSQDQ